MKQPVVSLISQLFHEMTSWFMNQLARFMNRHLVELPNSRLSGTARTDRHS